MFEFWLEYMFIPTTAHVNRPLLLILDGHSSHVSLKILDLLKQNRIICLLLPSHTTHALQPLDVVVFSSVKSYWSAIVKNHLKNGNKGVKNHEFARLMKKLFVDKLAFSPCRIVSSFARAGKLEFDDLMPRYSFPSFTGVWPFDDNAMREKVARNSTIPSVTSSSPPHPNNILYPRAVSSTASQPDSLHSTWSFPESAPEVVAASTTAFDDDPFSADFSPVSRIAALLPTAFVNDDVPSASSTDPPSYHTLQTCALDLTFKSRTKKKKVPTAPHALDVSKQLLFEPGLFST